MKGQTVRFILIFIIGSILLLTATFKQEGGYAQNSKDNNKCNSLI